MTPSPSKPGGWFRSPRFLGVLTLVVAAVAIRLAVHRPAGSSGSPAGPAALPSSPLRPFPNRSGGVLPELAPDLAPALAFDASIPSAERVAALTGLERALGPAEIELLFRALLSQAPPGESPADHATRFHELANLAQRQDIDPRPFAEVLAAVSRDADRDLATRDYALQHLRRIWPQAGPDLKGAIEATLLDIVARPGDLRATALLALHLLDPSGERTREDATLVGTVADILAADATASDSLGLRITAARIAGERRLARQRPSLLGIASSPTEHALVRMAAVHALGRIGDPSDLAALAALDPSDERLAIAISHATARP